MIIRKSSEKEFDSIFIISYQRNQRQINKDIFRYINILEYYSMKVLDRRINTYFVN